MRHRKALASVAALATVAGGALMASAPAVNAGPNTGPSLTPTTGGELVRGSDGSVHAFLPSSPLANPLSAGSSPQAIAKAFLQSRASSFGAKASDLSAIQTQNLGATGTTVKFQQKVDGLPVLGGQLIVSLDKGGNLQSITGETVSDSSFAPGLSAAGRLSNAKQIRQANAWVRKASGESNLNVSGNGQWVVNPSVVGIPNGLDANIKTNRYLVQNERGSVSYNVFVNDKLGVVFGFSNNPEGNARLICDAHNTPMGNAYIPDAMCVNGNSNVSVERKEGQGKSGITDVDKVYDYLGYTQLAYANYSGIDATKMIGYSDEEVGAGSSTKKQLRATIRFSPDGNPYPNAFWSNIYLTDGTKLGGQMWYGEGVTEDDVTGHELSHGVTSATSDLMYSYQSGAINESMSDVFGEIVDLTDQNYGAPKEAAKNAWLIGEGSSLGVIRSMKNPPAYDQPDKVSSSKWFDMPADPNCLECDQGGVHWNSGVGNKAGYLIAHGGSFNGQTVKGLGYAKTWAIYWTAQNLLTSGADYKDLFTTLQVACQKNIGNKYITKADCTQVKNAVTATEMYKNPKGTNVPVSTPYCPAGKKVKASAVYGFDRTPSGWSGVVLAKRDAAVDYVNTGNDAAFVNNKKLTFTKGVKVPANGLLRIDYAVMGGDGYYGATGKASLSWSTTGKGGWHNLAPSGSVNPSKWGQSAGWSTSKANLKRWAGKTLYFRFDTSNNSTSLFVDNFKVYNCT